MIQISEFLLVVQADPIDPIVSADFGQCSHKKYIFIRIYSETYLDCFAMLATNIGFYYSSFQVEVVHELFCRFK